MGQSTLPVERPTRGVNRWTEIPRRASAAWEMDAVRLIVLTVYYLAIIVALVAIYGGSHYKPPPFIYQGF